MRISTLVNSPHDGAVVWHWRHRFVQVEGCACAPIGPVASDAQVLCTNRVDVGEGGAQLNEQVSTIVVEFVCVHSNQARG